MSLLGCQNRAKRLGGRYCSTTPAARRSSPSLPVRAPPCPLLTACLLQEPGSTVLVAGATGGVGQLLTAKLLDVSAPKLRCCCLASAANWRGCQTASRLPS